MAYQSPAASAVRELTFDAPNLDLSKLNIQTFEPEADAANESSLCDAFAKSTGSVFSAPAGDQAMENRVLLALKADGVAGVQDRGGSQNVKGATNTNSQAKRDKAQASTLNSMMMHEILAQIKQNLIALNQQIEQQEAQLASMYGDDWREDLAHQILFPDNIVREDGESLEAYRDRLEDELVAELLNEDGSVKAEYADRADLQDYIQWAQSEYARDGLEQSGADLAAVLNDPNSTVEQQEHAIEHADAAVTLIVAAQSLDYEAQELAHSSTAANIAEDLNHNQATEQDAFASMMKMGG